MTEVEIGMNKELGKVLTKLAKDLRISREEAAERGFREGLILASAGEQAWRNLNQNAGISDELARTSKRIQNLRQQLSSTDTAYARANFEAFETFNTVGHLLMIYNVFKADVQSLSKMARDRGIEVNIDLKPTEIPGIQELLDRYLFRRERVKGEAISAIEGRMNDKNQSG